MGIGHGYLSMSFTIPDPKQATVIWYAYSHVQWTDAQLDAQAKDVSLRRKHMQCFDVSAWLGSHQQPHAAPIAELCQRVATFATTPDQQDAAFQYLSDPPRVRSGARPDLIGQRAGAILAEAALSLLGLGIRPPYPSWGSMLSEARDQITTAPWLSVFPGLAIFLTVLGLNLLGDGLRDILDPQSRSRRA